MPCSDMMITDVVTLKAGQTVGEAIRKIEDTNVRFAPVLDDEGRLVGVFSTRSLMKSLLPVSVTMERGLESLDFVMGTAPMLAKKLSNELPRNVEDVMTKDPATIFPEISTWEAIRLMEVSGNPLPVVDRAKKFLGLITEQSVLERLHDLYSTLAAKGELDD